MVRIPQRKVSKCNTYNNSFFFTIVSLQFSRKFCFRGCQVLITNSKLVISVGKRRKFSRRLWFLIKELFCHKKIFLVWSFYLDEIHSLLDNPLILPQAKILISFWSQKAENQKFIFNAFLRLRHVLQFLRLFLRHCCFYSVVSFWSHGNAGRYPAFHSFARRLLRR